MTRRVTKARVETDPWLIRMVCALATACVTPLSRWGVDTRQFRELLLARLRSDSRAPRDEAGRHRGRNLLWTCATLVLVGALSGMLAVILRPGAPLFLVLVVGYNSVALAMALLFEFGDLILGLQRGQDVLRVLPVSGVTLRATRIAHLLCYVGLLAVSLALGPVLAALHLYGASWVVPLYAWGVVGGLTMVGGFIAVVQVVLARRLPPDRREDAMVRTQILLVVAVIAGGSGAIGLFDIQHLSSALLEPGWRTLVVPPCWYAGLMSCIEGEVSQFRLTQAFLTVAGPLGVVLGLAGALRLPPVAASASVSPTEGRFRSMSWRSRLVARCGAFLTSSPVERAGFDFLLRMASRERRFKLQILPVAGLPLLLAITQSMSGSVEGDPLRRTGLLFCMFYLSLIFGGVLVHMRYSESAAAGWMFDALPLRRPMEWVAGAHKAVLFLFLAPYILALWIYLVVVVGWDVAMPLALAGEFVFFSSCLMARSFGREMPFRVTRRPADALGAAMPLLLTGVGLFLLGSLLFGLVSLYTPLEWACLVLLPVLAGYLVWELPRLSMPRTAQDRAVP